MGHLLYWTLLLGVVSATCGFRVSDRNNEISLTDIDESSIEEPRDQSWHEEIPTSAEIFDDGQFRFKCPEESGLFKNPTNCFSYFRCSGRVPHLISCPDHLHFSEKTLRCESPCVACCSTTIVCPKGKCGKTDMDDSSVEDRRLRSRIEEIQTSSEISEDGRFRFKCPEESGLFKNPTNCISFFRCSGRVPHLISCPDHLHFSEKTLRCESPCVACCSTTIVCPKGKCGKIEGSSIEEPREKSWHAENPSSAEVTEDGRFRFKCPEESGLFKNPTNCFSFFRCSGRVPHLISCPDHLHFSEKTLRCESPCVACCSTTIVCPKGSCGKIAGDISPTEEESFRDPSLNEEISTSREREFKCPKNGKYPNPGDCSSFVLCWNGVAHVKPCPEGRHYSAETKLCERPCDAHCDQTLCEKCKWPTCEVEFQCPGDGIFEDPRNCSSFVQCSNGVATVISCPEGLHYSVKTKQCEQPCDAYCNSTLSCKCEWPTCNPKNSFCIPPKDSGTCNFEFVRYFFNNRTMECEQFIYSGCGGNQNNWMQKAQCVEFCIEGNKQISAADEQFESLFQCPPKKNGPFPNPRNCSTFVQCSNGIAHVKPCPEGLHYSTKTKRCERPCEAYCNQTLSCTCKWSTCELPKQCFHPKETGPCRGSIPRYYFNKRTGECEKFTYGGCQGNANNYETKEACENSCSKVSVDDKSSAAVSSFERMRKSRRLMPEQL